MLNQQQMLLNRLWVNHQTVHWSAVDAVNKIRKRAGVKEMNAKYTGSLNGFMGELRRERQNWLMKDIVLMICVAGYYLLESPYNVKTSQEFIRSGS